MMELKLVKSIVFLFSPFFIYMKFVANKIRYLDTLFYKWLVEKNLLLGLIFNLLKVILFLYTLFLVIDMSIGFYQGVWALERVGCFIAILYLVPVHLGLVYHIRNLLIAIYIRGFVYLDDIAKIVAVIYIVTLLQLFTGGLISIDAPDEG